MRKNRVLILVLISFALFAFTTGCTGWFSRNSRDKDNISKAGGEINEGQATKINYTKAVLGNSRLPILMLHSVNSYKPEGGLDPHWEWSFKDLVERLYNEGYRTITAKEAYNFNINKQPLPEKSIWLTFDDGWADNLTVAAPILAKYGYVATVFVETSKIGTSPLRMTQIQIATLSKKYHWDIQIHGHVGHQPIPINGEGGKGSFYHDLKWLEDSTRFETIEERHKRVLADLKSSIKVLSRYNKIYSFAYPSGDDGRNPEIKADNDSVMNELGIMGVNVGKTGNEQIVPLNTSSPHKLSRIGVAGDTTYEKIFNITNFGLYVLIANSAYNTRFPVYDVANERFVVGTTNGKIMTVGKDWAAILQPTPVQKPEGSKMQNPASFIVPSILPNGDIWVGSITGSVLYKLDLNDLTKPASKEIALNFYPYNVINDGTNLYAFDTNGVVWKINTDTVETTQCCTLPNSDSASYTGSVLANGILYAYDAKSNQIVKYDFVNKSFLRHIKWNESQYQLQPWHILDDNNILCYEIKNFRHVVLEYR